MKNKLMSIWFLVLCYFALSGSLLAHHGGAAYDMEHLTTVKGTVTDFEFVNPHSQVDFDVKDDKGGVEKWIGETNSATALYRQGWTKTSVKAGDQVTAIGWRSKNGTPTLHLQRLIVNDNELPMTR
jgi:hypothetical protein